MNDLNQTQPHSPDDPKGSESPLASPEQPKHIGRYRVERMLGQGGYGIVYLAHDDQLKRLVAIKVPHPHLVAQAAQAEAYLIEARTVANLDHPHMVPVFDVGSTDQFPCFVVSKYIDGTDLAAKLKSDRLTIHRTIELMATVTEALHHAHKQGLVHRDIKPANILLDRNENPFVTDFGLALREQDIGTGPRFAGTPMYMSPEQARGEGHRVDGRSDIFSLGVVLYEMLTGRRPFRADSQHELLEQITTFEPRPPRQYDEVIPKEIDRICLKALSKRASERYSTAKDLADDLRSFLAESPSTTKSTLTSLQRCETAVTTPVATPVSTRASESQTIKIVPKGLRSFDAHDADFFLELLPRPRDRDDLPESIRFWKNCLEETDADNTFSVGLIYGFSGCGKSSFVKAGLLSRLADSVIAVYVEATAAETESRLLNGLRKRCTDLPNNLTLKETLASLRRGQGIPSGKKVVIILDQFEQWLHAKKDEQNTELVQALRQCDGGRVQCVVMVRDDFWLAVSRFLRELEIRLIEGQNSALADLFDVDHARKVLAALGRAFGKLPAAAGGKNSDQQAFLKQAVAGLAQEGKVIAVRLALFAEMMKSKPWIPATLKQVGGTEGVGATFLEETFSSATAPPEHRYHQNAARAVLKALLPDSGTDIKGHMRSYDDLLEASGYGSRPKDFHDLIRILDSEIRLIAPTDPESVEEKSPKNSKPGQKYYQLTHDYLVPSLRDWLTRKQRETRRGRAELKLAERVSAWNAKRETKQLPTIWEWLNIRLLTKSDDWKVAQREMMSRAGRLHGLRFGMAAASLLTVIALGFVVRGQVLQRQEATRIEGLVGRLVSADPSQLPEIVKQLDASYTVATTFLSPLASMNAKTVDEKRSQLHARLAMVARDKSLVEPLLEELLTNKVAYIGSIRHQMRPYADELTEKLQATLRDEKAEANRRFRAAIALADYVPESEAASWSERDLTFVARQLVVANAEFQLLLRENLRPISGRLLPDLEVIFSDAKATDAQRLSAANAFADYAARDMQKLSQLLTIATPEQYLVLFPLVAATPDPLTIADLSNIAATLPPTELGSVERVPYGQRRANAAVTLLRLGELELVLPVFDMTDDPEAVTQFILRCRSRGVRVDELLDLLQVLSVETRIGDESRTVVLNRSESQAMPERLRTTVPHFAKYALLLAIGEYTREEIPESRREALLKQLADLYRNDPSASVHGAAGWLLRLWGQNEVAQLVDQTAVPYSTEREWFTLAITVTPTSLTDPKEIPTEETEVKDAQTESMRPKTFYYTFVVFPAGESEIGSVSDEPKLENDEIRHTVTLTRPFAMLDREITMEELIAFTPGYTSSMPKSNANPSDAGFGPNWYHSVSFCRWLGRQSGVSEADQSYQDPKSLDVADYRRDPASGANGSPRNWPLELGRRGFRLPTETEWEIACRSGARTTYGYGGEEGLLGRFGWFIENSGMHVHPPRELRPSLSGLFDMHGNLSESTHDWFRTFDGTAVVDPLVSEVGLGRIFRGGSWSNDAAWCRSASRGSTAPHLRNAVRGFRLALTPSVESPELEKEKENKKEKN